MGATGATETWRVVCASGEVREVFVNHDDLGPWTAECPALFGTECGITPWAAVVRLTLRWPDRSREILAPGELSRAELIAERDALLAACEAFSAPDCGTICNGYEDDYGCGGCGVDTNRDEDPAAHDSDCPRLAARQLAAKIRARLGGSR